MPDPPVRARLALTLALAALAAAGCARGGDAVRASGTIEMDEVDVASLVGGRIAELRAAEGDTVAAGDTLVVLDRGEIAAELEAQAAQAAAAAAQARERTSGYRAEEIRQARAALADADAGLELAEAEWERAESLLRDNAIAPAQRDRARATRDQARARRDAAAERLRQLRSGYRREEVSAATNAAEAARAQLAAARSRAGELVLTAPIAGVVLLENFERGEIAGPGVPILTLGDPERLWIRVYVPAPELERVKRGAPAEVRVRRGGPVHHGRVVEIATRAEFTPRAALTEEERANLVFGVRIAMEPTDGALKPGLPAEARILPHPAAETRR